ncbi:MAG: tripartite tricarboxylate transporter permease, partial [Actinomycetia bacterium]|nr:tripartite tricarboxylate transporter permease [Actinomycetes bacterium]
MMLGFNLVDGFAAALTPENIALALIGCLLGTFIGLLRGIGPITRVALLFPIPLPVGLDDAPTL